MIRLLEGGAGAGDTAGVETGSAAAIEELRRSFEGFGLTGHEASVLVGLLMMGSAPAPRLARFAGVARANVYRMLEGLQGRGLAAPSPGERGLWISPGREEVIKRLCAAEDERHIGMRTKAERARQVLEGLGPEAPALAAPYVQVLRGGREIGVLYRRLLSQATEEVLVLNRGPYLGAAPVPEVLERARDLRMRALVMAAELETVLKPLLPSHRAYQEAGVDQRVVDDEIPLRLAIIDRRHVLTTLEDSDHPVAGSPTPLYVDHRGFAAAQVLVFEHLWARSRPFEISEGREGAEAHAEAVVSPSAVAER